jgi:hypothetical protein
MVKQPVASARGEVSEFAASLGRAAGDDQVTEDELFSLVLAPNDSSIPVLGVRISSPGC